MQGSLAEGAIDTRQSMLLQRKLPHIALKKLTESETSLIRARRGEYPFQAWRQSYFDVASSGTNEQIAMTDSASMDQSLILIRSHRIKDGQALEKTNMWSIAG
ncbi:hypothetical protein GQ457_09G019090 [Hibiscus cannabinus]